MIILRAIIISGGPNSVYAPGAPSIDPSILELNLPILGICYGFQLLNQLGGGGVARYEKSEYLKYANFLKELFLLEKVIYYIYSKIKY